MIISAAVVVFVATALAVWFLVVVPSTSAAEDEPRTQTVAASLTTLEQTVSATGTITPSVQESLSFEVAGTVTAVNVAEGDTVEAGTVIATVDDLAVTESLLGAKADLASAEARLSESEESSSGSDADVATISANSAAVDVAADAVEKAEDALDDVNLTATVAGTVTSLDLAVGDVVGSSSTGTDAGAITGAATTTDDSASTAQATIVATDDWTSTVSLSASDIENIAVDDQAELTIGGVDDTVFGTVTEIGRLPSSDSGAALYPVTITTTGSAEGLLDGLSAEIEIVYERRTDVLAVPSAAVTTTDGVSTVTQLDDDDEEVDVEVTVGETAGTYTEITGGLAEGDEVVVAIQTPTSGGGTGGEQTGEFPGGGQLPDGVELPEGFEPPAGFTGGQNG